MVLAPKALVYLDTSVINFLFAHDAPEKRDATIEFFEKLHPQQVFEAFITDYVNAEILLTKDADKRTLLINALAEHAIINRIIGQAKEIEALAEFYLSEGILPLKNDVDALHVAYCIVHNIPYLASWNYRHLVNEIRRRKLMAASLQFGYLHQMQIVTPQQLIDYGS